MGQIMIDGVLRAPSGGSGGALSDVQGVAFTASNAYSSKYHLWAAHVDVSKPIGLIVWFHGDGGYEYKNPGDSFYLAGSDGIIAQARGTNSVLIVPATPDDAAGRWTWWQWGSKGANPQYASELIQSITRAYNVDMRRVWLCGFSGGAEFLSLYLLRYWGDAMGLKGGGCLMVGGGTVLETSTDFPASFKPDWAWEWRVGELDTGRDASGQPIGDGFDAVTAATHGEAKYRSWGWNTKLTILPGKGHTTGMSGLYGAQIAAARANFPPRRGMVTPHSVWADGKYHREMHFGDKKIWEKGTQ